MKLIFLIITAIFALITTNAQSIEQSVWHTIEEEEKIERITSHEGVYSLFTHLSPTKLIFKSNGEFILYGGSDYFDGTYSYDYNKLEGRLILKDGDYSFKITIIGNYKKMVIKDWNKGENLILVGKDNIPLYNTLQTTRN